MQWALRELALYERGNRCNGKSSGLTLSNRQRIEGKRDEQGAVFHAIRMVQGQVGYSANKLDRCRDRRRFRCMARVIPLAIGSYVCLAVPYI